MGAKHRPDMKYMLTVDTPKDFYHEVHRPNHFVTFSGMEGFTASGAGVSSADADREDEFA